MKRNKIYYYLGAAVAALALAACSDEINTESPVVKDNGQAVSVVVSDHGFDNANPVTRADDSNEETIEDNKTVMTTEFVAGDAIGVFAINSETNIVVNDNYINLKLTKQADGTWKPQSGKEFLYYQGVDYFAYYPYKAGLTMDDVDRTTHTAEGFFHDYIAAFTPNEDQSTKANYTASDLMVGQGSLVGTECQFQMKHVMGLMVIQVPMVNWTYKDANDETNIYNVKEVYTIDKSNKAVYQIDKGEPYYRYIVRPNASELLTGKTIPNYDDGKFNVFSISHTGVDGGYYKKYVVDNATVTDEERTFKPGDVYYMDGTITDAKVSYKTVVGFVAYCGKDEVTLDNDPNETVHKQWHGIVVAAPFSMPINSYTITSTPLAMNTDNLNTNGLCFGDITMVGSYPTPSSNSQTFINTLDLSFADLGGLWKTRFVWNYRSGKYWSTGSGGRVWGDFDGIKSLKSKTKPLSELCETSNYYVPTYGDVIQFYGPKGVGGGDLTSLKEDFASKWTSTSSYTITTDNAKTIATNFRQALTKAGISMSDGAIVLSQYDKIYFATTYPSTTGLYYYRWSQGSTTNKAHWCCINF
jgi:hypothetical protein